MEHIVATCEEFWNNSSGGAFNFDDDQEQEKLYSSLEWSDGIAKESSPFASSLNDECILRALPIHLVITDSNLKTVLDDFDVLPSSVPSIQEIILKMYLGKSYMLCMFQSLDKKLELLDKAVLTADGNIIMTVLLYIRKSLKLSKLYYYLAKRKIATQHYINYLIKVLDMEELVNLFMFIRSFVDFVYLFYLESKDLSNKNRMLYKLTKFLDEYQHNLNRENGLIFLDLKKFTGWQVENNFQCNSVIEQLVELCEKEWSCSKENKIVEFKQFLKLNDFQYEWIILNASCALQLWPKLINTFIKPNWLSKKNTFKSVINIELFISTVYAHDPPRMVLEEFLGSISKVEEVVILAQKVHCYKFIIDFYISQMDRQSIINYRDYIPIYSEDCIYAEKILKATVCQIL